MNGSAIRRGYRMINNRGRSPARLTGFALIALLALPATAFANTSGPIAQTGGMSATIPLLGASLTVDVVLDTVGNITSVGLNPVGDFSATKVGPHAVAFDNAAGTTQVRIQARGDKLSLKATSGSLADLVGKGSWTADVFGTGAKTTVSYTIGDDGTGAPTLVVDPVVPADGSVVTQGTTETKSGHGGASARVRIDFALNGFVKHLSIGVSTSTEDGKTQARLSITLSGKDKQLLSGTLASLLGAHTWAGHLCDGTAVGIAFTVADDGTGKGVVSFDPATFATGAPATAKATKDGFVAWFEGTRTMVKVRLSQAEDGSWNLKVGAKTDRCKDSTYADPTVNTPINLKPPSGGSGWAGGDLGWAGGKGRDGSKRGNH
jgi:hypothetical protein